MAPTDRLKSPQTARAGAIRSRLPAQFAPHLFDRYTQGPASSKGGSGLGLSVVRDLVEAHTGTVRYDSPTRAFIVTLPAVLSQLNPKQ